jgi:hypothetical protein
MANRLKILNGDLYAVWMRQSSEVKLWESPRQSRGISQ